MTEEDGKVVRPAYFMPTHAHDSHRQVDDRGQGRQAGRQVHGRRGWPGCAPCLHLTPTHAHTIGRQAGRWMTGNIAGRLAGRCMSGEDDKWWCLLRTPCHICSRHVGRQAGRQVGRQAGAWQGTGRQAGRQMPDRTA
eukprot:1161288-Pelagomonas_calceolata.AAC.3